MLAVLLQSDWLLSVKTGLYRLYWWLSWNLYLCLVLSIAYQYTWLFLCLNNGCTCLSQLLYLLLLIYGWLRFVLLQLLLSAKHLTFIYELGLTLLTRYQPFLLPLLLLINLDNMSKSTHFFGQPVYGQLIKSLDHDKIVEISRKNSGGRYVKSFDGYAHFVTMLYAVIMSFDSLREIKAAMTAEVRMLRHVGISQVPRRSTLSDANARRSEKFFEDVYCDLYKSNKDKLSSYSRRNGTVEWIKRLRIIDTTTITLFSNVIFKGVCRHPKTGKKKGGIKVHSVIHANEGVPCDVRFTSAATNDSFMLAPVHSSMTKSLPWTVRISTTRSLKNLQRGTSSMSPR